MFNSDELMWGAAQAPINSRGASRRSDWFRWETTRNIEPSGAGNNFESLYSEDSLLFAEHGLTHLRFTLDWARVEPFPGRLDHETLEKVHLQLQAARDAGLFIWLGLHDDNLPGWFSEDTAGFRTTEGPSIHWSRHVDRMAELFDEYATGWIPVIDPVGWAIKSHLLGQRPPGQRSLTGAQDAIEGIVDATFDAHRLLSSGSKQVVGHFAVPTLHPIDPAANAATKMWEQTIVQSWTRAIRDGVLEWPWKAAIERSDMADAFAAIALGIESPIAVDPDGMLGAWPVHADRRDAGGWTPTSDSLFDVLHQVSELLPGKDLLVTGLGLDDEDDSWRSALFEGWLDAILGARGEGVPIRGVFVEPAIDGYSQGAGAFVDSGVFSRDREAKPSLRWIQAQQ